MKKLLAIGSIACIFSLVGGTFSEVSQEGIAKIRKGKKEEAKALFVRTLDLAEMPRQQAQSVLQISFATPPEKK